MGLNIEIKNVTFTKKIGSLIPVYENLIGYWSFDGTLTEGIKNKISGVSGTLVGAPTVSGGKINTDKANGFITDITISGEKTFIVVAKSTANAILLGGRNYDDSYIAVEGVAMFAGKPMVLIDGSSKPQSANLPDLSKIHFIAGATGLTSNSLYVSKGGVLSEETATHSGSLVDTSFLRIGGWGVNSTILVGSTETYAALVYKKKLSTAEVQAVFNYFKTKLSHVVID
jgi:hypothetical protein